MSLARTIVGFLDLDGLPSPIVSFFDDYYSTNARSRFLQDIRRIMEKNQCDYRSAVSLFTYTFYTRLLCSYRVLDNVSALYKHYRGSGSSLYESELTLFRVYLQKLKDFHSKLDLMHLGDWYCKMSEYYSYLDTDDSDSGLYPPADIKFFYNNVYYDLDELKDTFAYKAFKANVSNIEKERVKHKLQNDKNKLFLDDGEYNEHSPNS